MKMKFLFLLFLFPVLNGYASGELDWNAENIMSRIEKKHAMQQIKKNTFQYIGAAGGADGKEFSHLRIEFTTLERLNIDSARRYLVEGVLSYLSAINSDEELQEYLIEKPFPVSRIGYTLNVSLGYGGWPKFPSGTSRDKKISYARVDDNKICYLIDVHKNKPPVIIYEETFEEALALVKDEKE